jgi:GTP-binding protein
MFILPHSKILYSLWCDSPEYLKFFLWGLGLNVQSKGVGFIDHAKIFVKAGDGGRGCESFYKDRYKRYPVPDGGDGGDGGDVIIRANCHLYTLLDFRYRRHFKAKSGRMGSSAKKKGARGEDCIIEVPCGTQVFDADTNFLLRDLKSHTEEVVVARGGKGGRGNSGGSGTQQGEQGEAKNLVLELKLIADIGVVGFPNAGKSSLASKISTAKTKIASYPFTTKSPHLGLVRFNDRVFTVADIPGLIEGAHKGKGLGDRFLRHIERTKVLIYVLDMSPEAQKDPYQAYQILNNELFSYNVDLAGKTQVIVANKMDLPKTEEKLKHLKEKIGKKVFPISCKDGRGLKILVREIAQILWKDIG